LAILAIHRKDELKVQHFKILQCVIPGIKSTSIS
ncbi:MAG: hypothetical protein ACJAWX_001510, partial [Algoriphagus sp.]